MGRRTQEDHRAQALLYCSPNLPPTPQTRALQYGPRGLTTLLLLTKKLLKNIYFNYTQCIPLEVCW